MKKMEIKNNDFLKCIKILIGLLAIVFLMVILGNINVSSIVTKRGTMPEIIMLVLLVLSVSMMMTKNLNRTNFIWRLLVISIFVRMSTLIVFQPTLTSDFANVFSAAKDIFIGNHGIAMTPSSYFYMWPQQIGSTVFISLIMKIFSNDSLMFIQIISCIIYSFLPIIMFGISEKIFNEDTGRWAGVITALFQPYIFASTWPYNAYYAFVIYMLAIYIMIDENSKYMLTKINMKFILVGFCIAVASFLKDMNMVFIIAILIYLSFKLIELKDTRKTIIIDGISLIFAMKSMQFLIAATLISLGICAQPYYVSPAPSWGFLVGSNIEYKGIYNNEDAQLLSEAAATNKYEEFEKSAKQIIKNRYENISLSEYMIFLNDKTKILWVEQDSNIYYAIDNHTSSLYYDDLHGDAINSLGKIQLILIYGFSLLGILIIIKKNKISNKEILIILIFIGFFMGGLLMEVQSRYRLVPLGCLIMISAYAISEIHKSVLGDKEIQKINNALLKNIKIKGCGFIAILIIFACVYEENIKIGNIDIKNEIGSNIYTIEAFGKNVEEKDILWYIVEGTDVVKTVPYSKNNNKISIELPHGEYEVIMYIKVENKVKDYRVKEKLIVN